jgi:hypothetical protein
MSLTSYRAAPPRVIARLGECFVLEREQAALDCGLLLLPRCYRGLFIVFCEKHDLRFADLAATYSPVP